MSSLRGVCTQAAYYHVFTAVRAHPYWKRQDRLNRKIQFGADRCTLVMFFRKHPDFEAPLKQAVVQRQLAHVRHALRPVLFPHALGPYAAVTIEAEAAPGVH